MTIGNTNTKLLVRSQLPDHIANDYTKFVEFLETYYKFVEDNYSVKIESLRDVDNTSATLIAFLRKELLKNFPTSVINERKLIGTIRELYNRKGNLDSIKLLFKLFFNDSVIIKQPGTQILRASDGKWFQYYGITLQQINWEKLTKDLLRAAVRIEPYKTLFESENPDYPGIKVGDLNQTGTITSADALALKKFSLYPQSVSESVRTHVNDILLPFIFENYLNDYVYSDLDETLIVENVSKIVIENKFGRFTPTISFFEVEENKRIRVFFESYTGLFVEPNQTIDILGEDGTVVFTGKLTLSVSGLKIIDAGENWQKGQVFVIPGTVKNTVARVKETTPTYGIKEVEILEYGFSHDDELTVFISPYPVKPSDNSSFNVTTSIASVTINGTEVTPTSFLHEVTLSDITEGVTEDIYGETNSINYSELSVRILEAAVGIEPAKTLFERVDSPSGFKIGDINQTGTISSLDARLVLLYQNDPESVTAAQKDHIETILIPTLQTIVDEIDAAIQSSQPVPDYTGIVYEIYTPFAPKISLSSTETSSVSYNVSELDFDTWSKSRAIVSFTRDNIFKTKGYYLNDESIISNSETRLQDNYFFQLYSYLIETTKTEKEVIGVLNQFHPAGLKYFFQNYKENYYSIVDLLETFRALSTDVVFLRDFTVNFDVIEKDFDKVLPDDLIGTLETLAKILIRNPNAAEDILTELFVADDSDIKKDFTKVSVDQTTNSEFVAKDFTKISTDTGVSSDTPLKSFTKVSTDTQSYSDADPLKTFTKVPTTDTSAPYDTPIKNFTKVSSDTQSYSDAAPIKSFTKVSSDTQSYSDAAPIKSFTKVPTTDTSAPSDTPIKSVTKVPTTDTSAPSDTPLKSFTKVSADTQSYSDAAPIKNFTKAPSDTQSYSDAAPIKTLTKSTPDTVNISELPAKNVTKYGNEDAFSIESGTFLSISAEGYGAEAESYSAELYSQIAYEAYIG